MFLNLTHSLITTFAATNSNFRCTVRKLSDCCFSFSIWFHNCETTAYDLTWYFSNMFTENLICMLDKICKDNELRKYQISGLLRAYGKIKSLQWSAGQATMRGFSSPSKKSILGCWSDLCGYRDTVPWQNSKAQLFNASLLS